MIFLIKIFINNLKIYNKKLKKDLKKILMTILIKILMNYLIYGKNNFKKILIKKKKFLDKKYLKKICQKYFNITKNKKHSK